MPTFRRDMAALFRPRLREPGFGDPGLVEAMDAIFDRAGVPRDDEEPGDAGLPLVPVPPGSTGLPNEKAFFDALRAKGGLFSGGIMQPQLDGIKIILVEAEAAGYGLGWTANALATAYLETNKTMQPVAEAYFLGAGAEAWRRKHLRYWPWYGRGYPQTTWERNYKRADDALGLGGALMKNPDLMLTPRVAAPTMIRGMAEGWFTGKKLGDYIPKDGPGTPEGHKQARRIINGTDRWDDLARWAMQWQAALQAGGMRA